MKYEPDERIVIECPGDVKRRLYSLLSLDGTTMKDWFMVQADAYIDKKEKQAERKAGR